MAPRARFELATLRLTAECSTVELPGNRVSYRFDSITEGGVPPLSLWPVWFAVQDKTSAARFATCRAIEGAEVNPGESMPTR